jgi:hypothetical protein
MHLVKRFRAPAASASFGHFHAARQIQVYKLHRLFLSASAVAAGSEWREAETQPS